MQLWLPEFGMMLTELKLVLKFGASLQQYNQCITTHAEVRMGLSTLVRLVQDWETGRTNSL